MDVAENIVRALSSAPLPAIPGLWLFGVRIFLYRDTQPRPEETFWPVHVEHLRDCPFKCLETTRDDCMFEVFCDLASLVGPRPLCFYLHIWGLENGQGAVRFLTFHASALADPGPSGDRVALRSLLALLRSFPAGWTQTLDGEIRDGEIHDGDITR